MPAINRPLDVPVAQAGLGEPVQQGLLVQQTWPRPPVWPALPAQRVWLGQPALPVLPRKQRQALLELLELQAYPGMAWLV